ncbi:TonB-linked SusC/RagA family outer membrane protein [Chitinophaga ginsengisoli]|uniref:TonB-linked SusC/RagA family outer membrane protein n=2 Tax=Chitinophaga ginsengisoli TaxID=363837 RepID=A0A2P8FVV7_9BACT|nr:TonB-linked SusC/RagA family outer membrane protein [Chitinophaga ginsengisoli]
MPKVLLLQKGAYCPIRKQRVQLLFLMRLSLCVCALFALSLNLFATGLVSGQSITSSIITFEVHNENLKASIEKLQQESGFSIFYSSTLLNTDRKVTLEKASRTVARTLDLLLQGTDLTYIEKGNKVILQEKKQSAPVLAPVYAADKRLSGIVTDEQGNPIPGVTIRLKNNSKHTATDQNGHYSIEVAENDVLLFSYIGYTTEEVFAGDKTSLVVRLKPTYSNLNEVQVIGYGSTTKRSNTGAVSSITAQEISRQTVTNPLTALQGHIAGMQITQDNGLPGGGIRVQIRGLNTASAGFVPLYVVDGVPFTLFNGGQPTSDALNAYGISGANGNISPFSVINPEDIERIDVLKDADATAIYGSRGANGVVLITTKRGSQRKTQLNVNVYHSLGTVNHYIPMMNTQEYLQMRRDAFANSGVTPTASNAKDLTVWDQNAYTDWQKWALGGTAHTTNATASISGGNAQNSFLFSSTYRKEGAVFPGNFGANNYSGRLNATHSSLNGKFSIGFSGNYAYMGSNMPVADISSIYNLPPNLPLYNSDGKLNWDIGSNPMAFLIQKNNASTTNFLTNLNLGYKLTKELTLKANLGYSLTRLQQTNATPARSINSTRSTDNKLNYADNQNGNYIIEPFAEYNKMISKGKLLVVAGATFQQNKSTGISLAGSNYSNESLLNSIGSAGTVTVSYNNYSLYKYSAVFGRVNYSWQEKYLLDATFRRDGSSRFGPSHRFGNFGAIGAAWIFTQEDFMHALPVLSFGKLRASYGVTGNDQISNYQYNALYSGGGSFYAYMGTSTLVPSTIANPNLHWESTRKTDLALELGFFKDRILLKTDFYNNRSTDLLVYVATAGQTGTTSYTGNLPAVVQNRGWEFELNTINISTRDFRWTSSFNLTLNKNKLKSFPDLASSTYASSYVIGAPIDVTKRFHFQGVDPATGLPVIQDQDKDGTISFTTDMIPMKTGTPYYGGFSNSLSYKGFSLDFTFQFNHRYGYINNTLTSVYSPYGSGYTNQSKAILDRWKQAGDNAPFPAAATTNNSAYSYLASSDYNWGNASFIKFKTLSLTYALPADWLKLARISSASIYARAQNLFTWAKQKYTLDPETTLPGTGSNLGTGQYIAFPQLRTIAVGLNLTF